MNYWSATQIGAQIASELGLPTPASLVDSTDIQSKQILALLNSAGSELQLYYPWEQFKNDYAPTIVASTADYALPIDWRYFVDQTQWDRTNHWPLLGPKSPQEWAWLKGSFVASLPRIRFRVQNKQFKLFPAPASVLDIHAEYVSSYWVAATGAPNTPTQEMIVLNTDVPNYDPWLLVKFVKMKFYELKGFKTTAVTADFMRVFNSLTGQDTGAEILNLAPKIQQPYVGPWSIPDGSWNV